MIHISTKSITNIPYIEKIISKYAKTDNWHNIHSDSGNLGYGWIHYSLIRNLQPERVLCIGSRYGFIPVICALACKDNRKGVVDFVDPGYDQAEGDPNHNEGVGNWKKITPRKYFGTFGLNRHLQLHLETSEIFVNNNQGKTWGYIHIDGDHTYRGAKFDYQSFWPLLSQGGFMAFHDIFYHNESGYFGIHRLWNELKKKHANAIEFPGIYGLGVIQKNTSSKNILNTLTTAIKQRLAHDE